MDYIQDELLRQAQAFAALLGANTGIEETDKTHDSRALDAFPTETGETAFVAGLRRQSETNAWAAALAMGMLPEEAAMTAVGAVGAVQASSSARAGTAETVFPDAQNRSGTIPVVLMQNRAMDARELSRVFERDARRYNGAYPLY